VQTHLAGLLRALVKAERIESIMKTYVITLFDHLPACPASSEGCKPFVKATDGQKQTSV